MDNITVNGIEYVPKQPAPTGNRAVVIVDRGWIFAGDVEDRDGRIRITRAVWVFRWESVGFAAILADPTKADIRPMPTDVDMPSDAEIFRCPVSDSWGIQ